MSDPRLATLGDGGISKEAKAFVGMLPLTLSCNARNMLADFVTRSNARGTYIEDWLGEIAEELIVNGYLQKLEGIGLAYGAPDEPYTLYSYTERLLELRK